MSTGDVVVVCQVFHPDTQSTSQLLSALVRAVAERGLTLEIWSGFPGLHEGPAPPRREHWQNVIVRRGGVRAPFKRNRLLRAASYVTFAGFVMWRLLVAPKGRRVFVVTNPPFMPPLVWIACRMRRHQFVPLVQDLHPDGLTAIGALRRGGIVDRAWRWANGRTYRSASEVWVLGRDMAALIETAYGVPRERIRYVPHWSPVDFERPVEAESTALWKRLGLQGTFVVQYSGNMGLWHDMETLVRAAALLQSDGVRFLFIGDGLRKAAAERLSSDMRLRNATWLGFQPLETLQDSLSCCHVALISQWPQLVGVAVPCKLYGILASGRPVVAQVPAASETALVVAEEDCGIIVTPGDAQALADAILALKRDPERRAGMGRRAFAAYQAKYTLTGAVETFETAWR